MLRKIINYRYSKKKKFKIRHRMPSRWYHKIIKRYQERVNKAFYSFRRQKKAFIRKPSSEVYKLRRRLKILAKSKSNSAFPYALAQSQLSNFFLFRKKNFYYRVAKLAKKRKLRFWRKKRIRQWRSLARIHFNRKFLRMYGRVVQLPALRLYFLYLFDYFVLWFYFFFKKIEIFLGFFFFEAWCNVYFLFVAASYSSLNNLSLNCFSFLQFKSLSLIGYYSYFSSVIKEKTFLVRKDFINLNKTFFFPFNFSRFFVFACVFWNRHKAKYYSLRFLQKHRKNKLRFKYNRKKFKKYLPWWKRRKTTKFFLPSNLARLRFRRQHGRRKFSNYFLRAQLRRLKLKKIKKLFRKKSRKSLFPVSVPLTRGVIAVKKGKRIVKGSNVFNLNVFRKSFLKEKRKHLFNKYIMYSRKKLMAKAGPFSKVYFRLLANFILLSSLKPLNFKGFRAFRFFLARLHQKQLIIPKKSRKFVFSKRRKKFYRKYLFSKFIIGLKKLKRVKKMKKFFWRKHLHKSFNMFPRAQRLARIIKFEKFEKVRELEKHKIIKKRQTSEKYKKWQKKKRQKIARLKKLGNFRFSSRRLRNKRKKLYRKKRLKYKRLLASFSFRKLYNVLLSKRIKLSFFKHPRRQGKLKKRLAKINRRKLLVFVAYKKFFWKPRFSPSLLVKLL